MGITYDGTVIDDDLRREHGDDAAVSRLVAETDSRLRTLLALWPRGACARLRVIVVLDPPG